VKQTKSQSPAAFNQEAAQLQAPGGQKLLIALDQARLSSDGGLLVLASDPWTKHVIERLSGVLKDTRQNPNHSLRELMAQRILGIVAGYHDANDATALRHDGVFQAAMGRSPGEASALASQPTLCRLENGVSRRELVQLFYTMIDLFVDSYADQRRPEMLVLDLDPSACLTYGEQQLSLFNGHVGGHCLMPFHLYEGRSGRLIATVLRPGKTPTAREIIALLRRVVRRIRARWPKVELMLRADGHHSKPEVLDWLESNGLHYAIGYAPNPALERAFGATIKDVRTGYDINVRAGQGDSPSRRLHSTFYQAQNWPKERRVICRAKAGPEGVSARFIVTSFEVASAKALYDTVYCGRGEAELFIKEHKLDLGSDRMSCRRAESNQMRLFFHNAAYLILEGFRRQRLRGTALAKASFGQIRLRLIKIAARLDATRRTLRLHLNWQLPAKDALLSAVNQVSYAQAIANWT
jgi:hypothetical protein